MKGERKLLERGIIVFGAQQSGHCALATVLRKSPADVIQRCTLQQTRSFRDTSVRRYVVRYEGSWTPSHGRQPHGMHPDRVLRKLVGSANPNGPSERHPPG